MILMGSNPDQREEEEEEGDPPAPSNSRSGPFICEQNTERRKTTGKKHTEAPETLQSGASVQTEAGTEIQTHQLQMCRSFHRA